MNCGQMISMDPYPECFYFLFLLRSFSSPCSYYFLHAKCIISLSSSNCCDPDSCPLLFPHVCLCLSFSPYVRCIQDCRFPMWKRPHLQPPSRAGVRRAWVNVRPAPSSLCPTVVWVSHKHILNSLYPSHPKNALKTRFSQYHHVNLN